MRVFCCTAQWVYEKRRKQIVSEKEKGKKGVCEATDLVFLPPDR